VLPDDIKALVEPVLIHRLIRNTDSRLNDRSTTEIIDEIVDSVAAPGSEASFKPPVREK
jgi:MoxR-like ATPase